ncbi:hypothetical protein PPL_11778 [Heterostelium album PN500]|uniref:PH domain-containing protein n=1 Tax=Heterostelium pallidum (strain ATCC 26659 / Pp 5 / PN500) TaxID=670386 RepID=D3BUF8_HETP5|nr:hypothetical protein PPL_11778 [Heterostelium album PN500]EFA74746.1 hypothetical protein PPL_11778 [Heterostelium album PN500]|eukprot:XP_020426880.1 hypothetical protein PPL_11778 [Heterostelium album PN500]
MKSSSISDISQRKENSSHSLAFIQSHDGSDQSPDALNGNKKKKSGMVPNFLRKKFSGSESNLHCSSSNISNSQSFTSTNTSYQSIPIITNSSSAGSLSNCINNNNNNNNSNNNNNNNGNTNQQLTNSTSNGSISKLVQESSTTSLSVKVATPGSSGNKKGGSGSSSRSSNSNSNSNSITNSSSTSGGGSSSSSSSSYFSSNHSRSSSASSLSDDSSDSPLSESAELFISSVNRLSHSMNSSNGKSSKEQSTHHHHNQQQEKDNHNGVTLISSIPTTEYSWEVPQGLTIESIKQQALSDIEYILVMLSECQKTLGEKTKTNFSMNEMDIFDKKCKIKHKVAVMAEILKQFNFGIESTDVDSEFDSLTGGDEIERKTFLLARKTMNLKLEINKASSIKRVHVLNTIIQCISKFLKTNICPSEVPSIPLEMTITMGQGSGVQQYLGSTIYKKGQLQKKKNRSLGSKFSNKWIVLKHSELLIYSSEKEDQLLGRKSISDMTSITITPQIKEGHPNCFTLSFVETDGASSGGDAQEDWVISNNIRTSSSSSGSSRSSSLSSSSKSSRNNLVFSVESNESLIQWVLAIDGVTHSNFKSVMDLQVKEQLLSTFKSGYKGGIFRFGDEEWHYHDECSNLDLTNENVPNVDIQRSMVKRHKILTNSKYTTSYDIDYSLLI